MSSRTDTRYLLNLLCSFLCTYGLVCYFVDLSGVQSVPGPFATFLFCVGFFGFFAILHQQRIRLPLLLLIFLTLSGLMIFFDNVMQKFYGAAANFVIWLTFFVTNEGFDSGNYFFYLFLLLLSFIGLFCHVSISIFRSPYPMLLLTAASAIGIQFLLPSSGSSMLWLLPCIIGIALALSLTAKAEKVQEKFRVNPERPFLISMIAVLVSLMFIFFAAGIAMSDVPEKGFQSNTAVIRLNQLGRKIIALFNDTQQEPPPAPLYDSSAFGMRNENLTLGGSAELSDDIVFEVTSDRDLLLKGRTYDKYYSTHWGSENSVILMRFEMPESAYFLFQNSPEPIQIYQAGAFYQNPYPNSVILSLFDSFRPAPDRIPPGYGSVLFEPCDLTVKNASKLTGSSLFYPDHLVDAEFSDPLFFDEDASLFSKKTISIGEEYQIRSNVFLSGDPAFETNLLALEAYIIANPVAADDITHRSSIVQDYLEANVPESVTETALSITAGYTTPLEKAFAIQNYLRNNFTYSLDVPDIPEGSDFVEFFLESKTGYCTYFASAMCMMSRVNGIPARFVEGFYVDVPNSELSGPTTVIVSGKSAHAWCEIYIDGIGWIPLDSTPGAGANTPEITPAVTPSPTPETTTIPSETTQVELTATPPATPSPVPSTSETEPSVTPTKAAEIDNTEETPPTKTSRVFIAVFASIVIATIVIAAAYLWLTWRSRKYFDIPTTEELLTFGGPEKQLRFLWFRCLLHLKLADVQILYPETPLDFAARLENIRVSGKGCAPGVYRFDIRETASLYEQMIYGLKTPSAEDIEMVRKNCALLADQIRTIHFSAVHYIINRSFKHMKRR